MSRRVDASGKPADHAEASSGHIGRKTASDFQRVRRCGPGADDGHSGTFEGCQRPACPDGRRRIDDSGKRRRISRLAPDERCQTPGRCLSER